MLRWKTFLSVTLLAPAISLASPQDLDFFEDFEGFSPNTTVGDPILLGTSPNRAALTDNSFAGVIGDGSLYHSGIRSWMVLEHSVAFIDFFENNASTVEFFIKTHPLANGDTVVTAFDDADQAIGAPITISAGFSDPTDPRGRGFTLLALSGDIDHITIDNRASNFMNALDDFGFTNVPEPAAASLLVIGVMGTALRGRSR